MVLIYTAFVIVIGYGIIFLINVKKGYRGTIERKKSPPGAHRRVCPLCNSGDITYQVLDDDVVGICQGCGNKIDIPQY